MSLSPEPAESLSPLKRAILELRDMRAKLDDVERRQREPIAIVGYGLRLPGGIADETALWELLAQGKTAVGEIPKERWDLDKYYDPDPDKPGRMNVRHGAFIDDVDKFDADFFGISPREAASLDPQQRLLLETAWHALEHAGIPAHRLMGAKAGVFVGVGNSDYNRLVFSDEEQVDAYSALGNCYSVAAGRLSYFLGAQGPSLIVDTACSASLVALHLACQSLRKGECGVALAAGVNLILTPELHINFSKSRMLAMDGRCKTFDAAADGYVRGEGCAVVVLKPFSAALADGNRILALVRGSAINQDGRSGGLTAPNGPAQEAVIREALQNAGIEPHHVSYLEAHGTGTSLGDPIEVRAAAAVLGSGRPADRPLAIGSIKTNLGHLEGCAGLAGLLKVVLAFQHRQIPPHLHLQQKNPFVDWDRLPLTIPTTLTPWNPAGGRRIAGLSSFGFSGSNAHVILEEAPEPAPPSGNAPPAERPVQLLALSARDEATLKSLAQSYATHLASATDAALPDICHTANAGRNHFPHRVSILTENVAQLRDDLTQFVKGTTTPRVVSGDSFGRKLPPVALLFTGQGAQYIGMGRELYASCPVFRQVLDRCDEILQPVLPRPLLSVLYPTSGYNSPLDETRYTQPALFAIGCALGETWRSWGLQPTAALGHSVGEYVAAWFAGIFSLEDGLKLIAERARLMQSLPPGGRMAAVFAAPERVAALVAHRDDVSIAAINGPELVVVSGSHEGVGQVLARTTAEGVKTRDLNVSHAFHSSLLDPMLDDLARAADQVAGSAPHTTVISNLTGQPLRHQECRSGAYWRRHAREPVQFLAGIRSLMGMGVRIFVEAGPDPVLLGMARRCVDDAEALWLPSLRHGRGDWAQMLESVQALYAGGAEIDWTGVDRGMPRSIVSLPAYPFQRRRYWIERAPRASHVAAPSPGRSWEAAASAGVRQAACAPLGVRVESYAEKWDALRALTTAHAAATLRTLGAFTEAGEHHEVESVLKKTGIAATYHHLVRRWLERLVGAGLLRAAGDRFHADQPLDVSGLAAADRRVAELLADDPHLLNYIRNCGTRLTAVMSGQESPLETLFPGGASELAERLYDSAGMNRYANAIAGAVMEAASRAHQLERPFRVLEVGAGTGGTTTTVLPLLDPARSAYVFTDVSDHFLGRARERFGSFPFLRFGTFDLEKTLEQQGYTPHSFDVVAGTNVVHASRDLRGALERIRSLLVPGGFLLLVEVTQHHDWFDFTTGLIEGWQHFADDLRGDNPLLPADTWKRVLRENGFVAVEAFPEGDSPAQVFGQHVIIARTAPAADGGALAMPMPEGLPASATANTAESRDARTGADVIAARRDRIAEALPDERAELVDDYVRDRVMEVLRLDRDRRPDRRHRLMDLGLDSLMAVQLRNLLEAGLGLDRTLPATLMFDYPTIEAISNYLQVRLTQAVPTAAQRAAAPAGVATAATPVAAAEIAAMSDEEAEAQLLKRLERRGS